MASVVEFCKASALPPPVLEKKGSAGMSTVILNEAALQDLEPFLTFALQETDGPHQEGKSMTSVAQLQERLNQLPEEQREALAARLLEEVEAALADDIDARKKGAAQTVDGLRALRKQLRLGSDLTVRDLIEEGRRA